MKLNIRRPCNTFSRKRKGRRGLIEKLLSLARADAGRESLEIRRLDLGDTMRQIANDWRHEMASHQLRFTENVTDR